MKGVAQPIPGTKLATIEDFRKEGRSLKLDFKYFYWHMGYQKYVEEFTGPDIDVEDLKTRIVMQCILIEIVN
jgi:hypothetical protein